VQRHEPEDRRVERGIAGSNLRFNICSHFGSNVKSDSIKLLVLVAAAASRRTATSTALLC
jgi:hypothetical protein